MKYKILKDKVPAIKLDPSDDHVVYLIPLGYSHLDLYCVIFVDAYATPTSEIMNLDDIEKKYNVKIEL